MIRSDRYRAVDSVFVRAAISLAVVWLAIVSPAPSFAERVVSTFAGLQAGNGPALNASLDSPAGVAVDSSGNVYISDTNNHRVMKLDVAAGQLQTVAGGQSRGYSGDGGLAVNARLNQPRGLAVDDSGNIYFADSGNHCIRKVDGAGIITTVAGTGSPGFSGDGRPAVSGRLTNPFGVAVDSSGNLYVADLGNHRIRKIDSGGIISTVPGTDSSECPTAVAVDAAGNVFFSRSAYSVVDKVDAQGTVRRVAGRSGKSFSGDGGPATGATLMMPFGVALDQAGHVYIADTYNQRIRKVAGGIIETVAGSGYSGSLENGIAATQARLNSPFAVAVDQNGNIYIADTYAHRIRKVDVGGNIVTVAGRGPFDNSGDGKQADAAILKSPHGLASGPDGSLYIADATDHRIRKVSAAGVISTLAGTGREGYSSDGVPAHQADLDGPCAAAVGPSGTVYFAESGSNRVRKISGGILSTVAGNGSPGYSGDGGPAESARLNHPTAIAVDGAERIYIADTYNHRIRMVNTLGRISTLAGTGSPGFAGDGGPAAGASLNFPNGVAADGAGNVFIADTLNHRIRKVDGSHNISTVAGTGEASFSGDGGPAVSAGLNTPHGVWATAAGVLYIADAYNYRVRKVEGGNITTFAGSGEPGFSGDGGLATAASFRSVHGLTLDSSGSLFVADMDNSRVRKVQEGLPTVPTTRTVCAAGCDYQSIQAAIDAGSNGDEVRVRPGTYVENINLGNKGIAVIAVGGSAETIIDGGAADSTVKIGQAASGTARLSGFTVRNGSAALGGGITISGGSPWINHCIVTQNQAGGMGGGIYLDNGSAPTFWNCTVQNNQAVTSGGGICSRGNSSPVVIRSEVTDNQSSGDGGGVFLDGGTLRANETTFANNTATTNGGGLAISSSASLKLQRSVIKGNTGNDGGGIHVSGSASLLAANSILASNTAQTGAGMSVRSASASVYSMTFAGNTATSGAVTYSDNSSVQIRNCILWDNSEEIQFLGTGPDVMHSDVKMSSGTYAGTGNINTDPKFKPGDGWYHLLQESPCINTGAITDHPVIDLDMDIDGQSRSDPGLGQIDMGADEATVCTPVAIGQSVNVEENQSVAIRLSATDAHDNPLQYAKTQPSHGKLTGTAPSLTYMPDKDYVGPDSFSFTAGNGYATSVPAVVTITVKRHNDPPKAKNGTLVTNEDTPAGGVLTGTDPNNDSLTYSIFVTPTKGTVAIDDAATGAYTYTPKKNFAGSDAFTFRACDGLACSVVPGIIAVTVKPVNDPPKISRIEAQTIQEDTSTAALPFTVSDVDNLVRTVTVSGKSSNSSLVSDADIILRGIGINRTVRVVPLPNRYGATIITLTVSDGALSSTTSFRLTVTPVNDPPTISPIPAQKTREDVPTKAIAFTVSDVDDPPGVLTVTGTSSNTYLVPKSNIVLSGLGAHRTVTITPAPERSGTAEITLRVSDGALQAKTTFLLTVLTVNDRPVADAGPTQTVKDGVTVKLNGSNSSDIEREIVSYLWTQIAGPPVQLSGAQKATASFPAPGVGPDGSSLMFNLTITDQGGLKSSESTIVNVTTSNRPPVASAGLDQTVRPGRTVTLDGSASSDKETGIASYLWKQLSGPPVTLSSKSDVKPTFTAPAQDAGGVALMFRVTVKDFGGLRSRDECIVNVTTKNVPPTARAGGNRAVLSGAKVVLNGSNSTDPDDGIVRYRWTQTEGPPVRLSSPTAIKPSFTAPNVTTTARLVFRLIVTDRGGLCSRSSCVVTVKPAN